MIITQLVEMMMNFKFKNEAYSHAVYELLILRNQEQAQPIDECLQKIQIAIENHEQDIEVVANYLRELVDIPGLSAEAVASVTEVIKDLRAGNYEQEAVEKFNNPLARRFESELPILLLQKPTKKMMEAVGRVSKEINKALEDAKGHDLIDGFLHDLQYQAHPIGFGGFDTKPTLKEVIALLAENDPTQLAAIMHIHFKFAKMLVRDIPIMRAPVREPVGKLKNILREVWKKDLRGFFSEGISQIGSEGYEYRAYVSDAKFYKSSLFTAERNRGRAGVQNIAFRTNQQGLMLNSQKQYEGGLPTHSTEWSPDCKTQDASYLSAYVKELINFDCVYVAGPSGMTSLLLGTMETIANFESEELKKHYLTAVFSYIVAGGFHSLHEVVGPAEYCLGLVPGYKVTIPSEEYPVPPNFNAFYTQQASIDPEFAYRYKEAWNNYIQFYDKDYVKKSLLSKTAMFEEDKSVSEKQSPAREVKWNEEWLQDLYLRIVTQIQKYIDLRDVPQEGRILKKSMFFNEQLTAEKLDIAKKLLEAVKKAYSEKNFDYFTLYGLVFDARVADSLAENKHGKTYLFGRKGELEKCFDQVDLLLMEFSDQQKRPTYK